MSIFDPRSFIGMNEYVLNKHKTVEERAAYKRQAIDKMLGRDATEGVIVNDLYGGSEDRNDGDTVAVRLKDGTVTALRAKHVDTADKSGTRITDSKREMQRISYAINAGIPLDQVTDDHIDRWAAQATANRVNNGFAVGDTVRFIEGEASSPNETRTVADIYNAAGKTMSETTGAQFDSSRLAPWNQSRAIKSGIATEKTRTASGNVGGGGWNANGDAVVAKQADGTYTYGNLNGILASELPSVKSFEKAHKDDYSTPDSLVNNVLGAAASFGISTAEVPAKFAAKRFFSPNSPSYATTMLDAIDDINQATRLANRIEGTNTRPITDNDLKTYRHLVRKFTSGAELTPEEQAAWDSPRRLRISEIESLVSYNKAVEDKISNIAEGWSKAVYNPANKSLKLQKFSKTFEDDGFIAAIGEALYNDPLGAPAEVAASLPTMLLTLTGVGMYTIYEEKLDEALTERQTAGSEPLTRTELNTAKLAAAAATLLERFGAELFLNKIPGMKKLAIGLYKSSPTAARILTPFTKFLTVSGGEAGQEALTSVAEQVAGGKVDGAGKLDTGEIAYSAYTGAFGSGGLKAPGTAIEVLSGQGSTIRAERDSLEAQLATPDTVEGTSLGTEITARIAEIDKILGEDTAAGSDPVRTKLVPERANLVTKLAEANPDALSAEDRAKLQSRYDSLTSAVGVSAEAAQKSTVKELLKHIKDQLDPNRTMLVRDVPAGAEIIKQINDIDEDIKVYGETPEKLEQKAVLDAQLDQPAAEEDAVAQRKVLQENLDRLTATAAGKAPPKPAEDAPIDDSDIGNEEFIDAMADIRITLGEDGLIDADTFESATAALDALSTRGMTLKQQEAYDVARKKLNEINSTGKVRQPEGSISGTIDGIRKIATGEAPNTIGEGTGPQDAAFSQALTEAADLHAVLTDSSQTKDTLEAVHSDVVSGKGKRFKGFDTYLSELSAALRNKTKNPAAKQQEIKAIKDRLHNHVKNTVKKAKQFRHAYDTSADVPAGMHRVVFASLAGDASPTNRLMKYDVRTISDAEFAAAQKDGDYVNKVHPGSSALIKAIEAEAEYAKKIEELANTYENTSFAEATRKQEQTAENIARNLAKADTALFKEQVTDDADISTIGKTDSGEATPAVEDTDTKDTAVDDAPVSKAEPAEPTSTEEPAATPTPATAATEPVTPKAEATAPVEAEPAAETVKELPIPGRRKGTPKANSTSRTLDPKSRSKQAVRTMFPEIVTKDGTLKGESVLAKHSVLTKELSDLLEVPVEELASKLKELPATVNFAEGPLKESLQSTNTEAFTKKAAEKRAVRNNVPKDSVKDYVANQLRRSLDAATGILNKIFPDLVSIKNTASIATIPTEAFGNAQALIQALKDLGLKEATAKKLQTDYVQYAAWFDVSSIKELMTTGVVATTKPVTLLHPEDDTAFPPQVVFALMLAAQGWRQQNLSNKVFGSNFARESFLYGSQTQGLSLDEKEQIRDIGHSFNDAVNTAGTNAVKLLGLSPNPDEVSLYYDHLVTALGAAAIAAGQGKVSSSVNKDTGLLSSDGYFTINWKTFQFNDDAAGRIFHSGMRYRHIITNSPDLKTDRGKAISEANKATMRDVTLTLAVDLDPDINLPNQTATQRVATKIRGVAGGVPQFTQRVLRKLQNNVWTHANMLPTYAALGNIEAGRESLEALAEVVAISDSDHAALRSSWEDSNGDKISDIDTILALYADERNPLKKFYMTYKLMNQHRVSMQGKMNPQASHILRYLVRAGTPTRYSDANMHLFKMAVLFNLGYKTDKNTGSDMATAYNKHVSNKHIIAAVKAMRIEDLGERAAALAGPLMSIKADPELGGDTSILAAVQALAAYQEVNGTLQHTAANTIKSFESDVPLEIDGIANGTAIGILQFPHFETPEALERIFNLTGTRYGSLEEAGKHLVDGVFKGMEGADKLLDVYTDFGQHVLKNSTYKAAAEYNLNQNAARANRGWKAIQLYKDVFDAQNAAINSLFSPLASGDIRKFVKYPFMINQYGGGVASISRTAATDVIKDVYLALNTLQREYVASINDDTARTAVLKRVDTFLAQVDVLGGFGGEGVLQRDLREGILTNSSQEMYLDEGVMIKEITNIFKPRFEYALDAMLGYGAPTRKAVVQSVEIMHFIHTIMYDRALARKRLKLERHDLSNAELDEVAASVTEWLPQVNGVLMQGDSEKSFLDLSKQEVGSVEDRIANVDYKYRNNKGRPADLTASTKLREFVAPGVSALIRMVINMDASILTKMLGEHPDVLMLHDAFFGQPEVLAQISKKYGELYLKYGKEYSIVEAVDAQLAKVMAAYLGEDSTSADYKANKLALEEMFADQAFVNRNNIGNNSTKLHDVQLRWKAAVAKSKRDRGALPTQMTSDQMYMADAVDTVEGLNADNSKFYSPRLAAIAIKTEIAKKKIFFAQEAIADFTDTAKQYLDKLASKYGMAAVADMFNKYLVENSREFLDLRSKNLDRIGIPAQTATSRTLIKLQGMLDDIEDDLDVNHLLSKMLIANSTGTEVTGRGAVVAADFASRFEGLSGPAKYSRLLGMISKDLEAYEIESVSFKEPVGQQLREITALHKELGSLDNAARENVVPTHHVYVDGKNVMQLSEQFKDISERYYSSPEEMAAHSKFLDDVMRILAKGIDEIGAVKMTVNDVDGITQGTYDSFRNKVNVYLNRELPATTNGHSPQEVYVHEMVHAMSMAARAKHPLISRKIQQLYNQVRKELGAPSKGYRIFLEGDPNTATAEDIALAKDIYNNLFHNPSNEANILDEFLANAVANRGLIRYLQGRNTKLPVRDSGIFGQLLHIMDLITDVLTRIARGTRGNNAHQDMIAVMERLVAVQAKHSNRYQQYAAKFYDKTDELDNKIRGISRAQASKIIAADTTNSLRKLGTAVVGGTALYMSDNAVAAKVKLKAHGDLHRALWETVSEIGDGALSKDLIERLLHSKNKISKQRQEIERDFIMWFNDIWVSTEGKELKPETTVALTDVMLRTELSSLLDIGMSHQDIMNLVTTSPNSKRRIPDAQKRIRAQLRAKSTDNIIKYAEELGLFMATGNTSRYNGHMNGTTIARVHRPGATNQDVALIEAYASIEALKHTAPAQRDALASLISSEFATNQKSNAFIDILDYHKFYANESVDKLFNGNRMQRQHGYLIERVDNLTDVQAGTLDQEKTMRRGGYTEMFQMSPIPGAPVKNDVLYVSRNMPEITDVSGIISNTGQTHAGTTLSDIFANDPAYQRANGTVNYAAVRAKIRQISKAQAILASKSAYNDTQLRPLRDDAGNIVDYRIMMNHASSQKLLQPDLEFQNVFAHMQSSLVDKQQTIINDMLTIDTLVAEQVNVLPENPKTFVDLLDPTASYHERFLKLPREVREYLLQYVGSDGTFMIRQEIINKVFGYKAKDLSNLDVLQNESATRYKQYARLLHYTARNATSYVKMLYVLATPAVMLGNIASNITQLVIMQKIPPEYVFMKFRESVQQYAEYRKDTAKLRSLKNEIDAKKLTTSSPEYVEYTKALIRARNNKLYRMSDAGLHTLIIEDLNTAATDGYINRGLKRLKADKFTNKLGTKVPNTVGNVASTLFMTKGTSPGRATRQMVQLTDFMTRYVMIEYGTEVKGQTFNEAMHEAIPAFILFDENLPPWLEALEGINMTMFVSFWLRAQRVARKLVNGSPTGVATAAALQYTTDAPFLGVINSTWMQGRVLPGHLQQGESLEKIFGFPAIDFVQDLLE